MARAGLGLSIEALAKLTGARAMTISKFERGLGGPPATVEKLRAALVAEGAEFINGGKSLGVKVPRLESLAEQGAALKEAKAAHRKVVRLVADMRKGGKGSRD